MRLTAVTLDCADPVGLAAFYRAATGWEPHPKSDADFAGLTTPDGLFVGFQRVDGHRAPTWPDQSGVPQQSHLDFDVDDLDAAEKRLLALGATRPPHAPDGHPWRVLLDPAGHPFCLSERRA
ncbi:MULTISPECIES: VOC family protein [unclassified Streptomyces]|uniref:VOC family protein n=1 Tax=unclassified Streptomyces TaxID=2593676 RepID=UPI000DDA3AA2|nr:MULTISPECIES: VOC family protein [unclassified Streptomyces]QZZ28200.1 VOC family protein [Streptomyces sp. ST1015]